MVWCCGPVEALSPEERAVDQNKNGTATEYPAQRREYVPPNGNAMIAGTSPNNFGHEGEDLVSVIVPEGVGAGQTIAVMAPDGSRLVRATIPPGLKCGDTFLVRLSKAIHPDVLRSNPMPPPAGGQPIFANALEDWTTPIDQKLPDRAAEKATIVENVHVIENASNPKSNPTFVNALDRWLTPIPDAVHQHNDNNSITETVPERDAPPATPTRNENQLQIPIQDELASSPPLSSSPKYMPLESPKYSNQEFTQSSSAPASPSQAPRVSGQPVNAHIERAEPQLDIATSSPKSSQKLLLVHVPSGMPAGSIMQVEIPGEDRTVSAQIPHGAQSFHIAYTPRISVPSPQSSYSAMPPPPLQAPSTLVSKQNNRPKSPKGHKLLLVRVPQGTAAGTTLHVSVPDEPGRILAAQVPPGNVQEFHVSYEARPKKSTGRDGAGMLPPASPYYPQQQQFNYDPNYQQQPAQHPSYYHPNGPNQYHPQQQPSPAGGYWFPSMVGATAMGAAGAAAYEHFQHPQNGNEFENGDMMGDPGGDYELTDF